MYYNIFECQCQHVESMIFEMTIYLWYCEYSSLGQGGINPAPAGLREPEDFTITEKAPTRAFSWLKAPTSAFKLKTLC